MTTKSEKEKAKLVQDRCQTFLTELLKDEDNKYCVDCDAKGPRWASWNLGIFLCIRCAGIHRNLGVHISKVKSVNLDSWTPEQIGYLQQMGNSKARAVYEANLPDDFRRPQTDSSLEAFIRSKYEQKKYIAKEWAPPPTPPPAFDIDEERKKEKEGKRKHKTGPMSKQSSGSASSDSHQTNSVPRPHSNPAGTIISADKVPKDMSAKINSSSKSNSDLLGLGLDFTTPQQTDPSIVSPVAEEDPFAAFVSSGKSTNTSSAPAASLANEESDFFNQKVGEKKLDKDSILKMFDSSGFANPAPPVPFAVNNNLIGAPAPNHFFASRMLPGGMVQNGQSISQTDPLASNPATNPFLMSPPTSGAPVAPPASSLFQDLSSLSLGSSLVGNWAASSNIQSSAVPVVQRNVGPVPVNPFSPTVAPVPTPAPQPLFADFSQAPATSQPETGNQSLNWGFGVSDLWQ